MKKVRKKAELAIFISYKIHFKTKSLLRDKGGQYIIIKGAIQQVDITLVNIHAPFIGAP